MNYLDMRRLDALIAEKVFKQTISWDDSPIKIPGLNIMGQKIVPHITIGGEGVYPVPLYSSTPSDMWLLLDEIKKLYSSIDLRFSTGCEIIAFDSPHDLINASAATAPLAVCRLALEIWGIEFKWQE